MRPPRRWSSPPRSSAPIWRRRPRSGARWSSSQASSQSRCPPRPTFHNCRSAKLQVPAHTMSIVKAPLAVFLSSVGNFQSEPCTTILKRGIDSNQKRERPRSCLCRNEQVVKSFRYLLSDLRQFDTLKRSNPMPRRTFRRWLLAIMAATFVMFAGAVSPASADQGDKQGWSLGSDPRKRVFLRFVPANDGPRVLVLGCLRDRKSTRLNSSHTVISYAVFCLTKRKVPTRHRPS